MLSKSEQFFSQILDGIYTVIVGGTSDCASEWMTLRSAS